MAIRQEDLLIQEAIVYRFPTEALRARRARAVMVARRRRSVAVAALLVAGALLVTGGPAGRADSPRPQAPGAVTVVPGDTLWGVAERFAPEGRDLRAYVAELSELNGLDGALRPGTGLKLPRR